MKKFLKWTAIVLGIIIVALAAAPFLFKDKIQQMVIRAINNNLEATVDFDKIDLSLFRSFPMANVSIQKLSVINKAPFEGDTLVYSDRIDLKMSVKELFKSADETIEVEYFSIKDTQVNLIFNPDGLGNFDIAIKSDEDKEEDTSEDSGFSMKLQGYEVENLKFTYLDQASNMKMVLDKINHKGTGDFTNSVVDLDTYTSAVASFDMDDTNYLNNVNLILDADLSLDLENSKYTFKENMARINKLPLEFDGFLQLKEEGQEYDLTFNTPTTSFSNFLGLIPSAYSGELENITTTGDFSVKGFVKGILSETTIPQFDIAMASDNASFKYPDLPKTVQNIIIDAKVRNETGLTKDIYVDLDQLSFKIDQDVFNAKAKLRNVTENMLVDANLNGTINLANLSQAYPIQLEKDLKGVLRADVGLSLDMLSIEQEQYENVKAQGTLNLTGFEYDGEELAKPLVISEADLKFNPSHVALNKLDAKTGKSDIQATGTLDNFYGFMFKDQTLKANFNLTSNHLEVADLMTTSTTETSSEETTAAPSEDFKIPSFLDCIISAKASTVVYDNLTLKNVSGKLAIKDETVALQNVVTSIFGGNIGLEGTVSTQGIKPLFDMNLNLNALDISSAFTQLEMLEKIAPIAGVISGKINSTIKLNGKLDAKELTPDLATLTGDLIGQFLETKVNADKSKLLSSLDSHLNFIDFEKLNIDKLKTHLTFENGKVNIQPIDLSYDDINIELGGTHGFDQSMNYGVTFDVPAKYLGKEVTGLLANLSGNEANTMTVPIKANITGDFSNPKIQTDMKQVVTNLTNQIVEKQKTELVNKGKDALEDAIGKDVDIPTSKEEINQKVEDAKEEINQKIEEKKEEAKEEAKDKAKEALRDLLNKKKDKEKDK